MADHTDESRCTHGGACTRRARDAQPIATVYGAGIAGLSAAHELVERGFLVQVVEPTESKEIEGACEVGGIAATQWAHLRTHADLDRTTALEPLPPFLGSPGRVYFRAANSPSDVRLDPDLCLKDLFGELPQQRSSGAVLAVTNRDKLASMLLTLQRVAEAYPEETISVFVIGHTEAGAAPGPARDIALAEAAAVIEALRNTGQVPPKIELKPRGYGSDQPWGDNRFAEGRLRNNRVELEILGEAVPGDHGYRFFPRFYRNLDDTMRRTPLLADGRATGSNALSRLKPPAVVSIAFADNRPPIDVPRRRLRSFEELRTLQQKFGEYLKHATTDIALYQLKMFEFMTTCSARRRGLDKVSWFRFVVGCALSDFDHDVCEFESSARPQRRPAGARPYTDRFLCDLETLPQAMAGMTASESDALTNGNINLQMMIDQQGDGHDVDRLLSGPTSTAWLRPWKEYLQHQGVRFFVGTLEGFDWCPETRELLPRAVGHCGGKAMGGPCAEPIYGDELMNNERPAQGGAFEVHADFHILATPIHHLKHALTRVEERHGDVLEGPLRTIAHFDVGTAYDANRAGPPTGPFRDLSGMQLYFANDFKFAEGHTYFAQSAWRITSISQLQYWRQRRTTASGYLGILSLDVGAMHTPDDSETLLAALEAEDAVDEAEDAFDACLRMADEPGEHADSRAPATQNVVRLARAVATQARVLASENSSRLRSSESPAGLDTLRRAARSTGHVLGEDLRLDGKAPWSLAEVLSESIAFLSARCRDLTSFHTEQTATATPADVTTASRLRAGLAAGRRALAALPPVEEAESYLITWQNTVGDVLAALCAALDLIVPPEAQAGAPEAASTQRPHPSNRDHLCTAISLAIDAVRFGTAAATSALRGKTAWNSEEAEFAAAVWRQVRCGLGPRVRRRLPDPLYYRIDRHVVFTTREVDEFDALGRVTRVPRLVPSQNTFPYMMNAVGGFDRRPGVLPTVSASDAGTASFYAIANKRWIPIGTFMKTYTRIGTMELSNESARHGVRAALHALGTDVLHPPRYNSGGRQMGDMPGVWNPENHELDDLAFLKRLDQALYDEGLPHLAEILRLDDMVIRWAEGMQGGHALDDLVAMVGVLREQAGKDLAPLLDGLEMAAQPIRNFIEKLAEMATRP